MGTRLVVGSDRSVAVRIVGDDAAVAQAVGVEADGVVAGADVGGRLEVVVQLQAGGLGEDVRLHGHVAAGGDDRVVTDAGVRGGRHIALAQHHPDTATADGETAAGGAALGADRGRGDLHVAGIGVAGRGHRGVAVDRGIDLRRHVGHRAGTGAGADAARGGHRADLGVAGIVGGHAQAAPVHLGAGLHLGLGGADDVAARHHGPDRDRPDRAAIRADRGGIGRGGGDRHVAGRIHRRAVTDPGSDAEQRHFAAGARSADARVGHARRAAEEAARQRDPHRIAVLVGLHVGLAAGLDGHVADFVPIRADRGVIADQGIGRTADLGHGHRDAEARAERNAAGSRRHTERPHRFCADGDIGKADTVADMRVAAARALLDRPAAIDPGAQQGTHVARIGHHRNGGAQADEATGRTGETEGLRFGVERGDDLEIAIPVTIGIRIDAVDGGPLGREGADVGVDGDDRDTQPDARRRAHARSAREGAQAGVVAGIQRHIACLDRGAGVDGGRRAAGNTAARLGGPTDRAGHRTAADRSAPRVGHGKILGEQLMAAGWGVERVAGGEIRGFAGFGVDQPNLAGVLTIGVRYHRHHVGLAFDEATDVAPRADIAIDHILAAMERPRALSQVRVDVEGVIGGIHRRSLEGIGFEDQLVPARGTGRGEVHRNAAGGLELDLAVRLAIDDVGGAAAQAAHVAAATDIAVDHQIAGFQLVAAVGVLGVHIQGVGRGVHRAGAEGGLAVLAAHPRHHACKRPLHRRDDVVVILAFERIAVLRILVAVVSGVSRGEIAAHRINADAARQAENAGAHRNGVALEVAPYQRIHVHVAAGADLGAGPADQRTRIVAEYPHVHTRARTHCTAADRAIDGQHFEHVGGDDVHVLSGRGRARIAPVDLGTAQDLGECIRIHDFHRHRAGNAREQPARTAGAQGEDLLGALPLHEDTFRRSRLEGAVGIGFTVHRRHQDRTVGLRVHHRAAANHRIGGLGDRGDRHRTSTAAATDADAHRTGDDPALGIVQRLDADIAARVHAHVAADGRQGVHVHHQHRRGTRHADQPAARDTGRHAHELLLGGGRHLHVAARVHFRGEGGRGVGIGAETGGIADPRLGCAEQHRHGHTDRTRTAAADGGTHAHRDHLVAASRVHVDALRTARAGVVLVDVGAAVDVGLGIDGMNRDTAGHVYRDHPRTARRRAGHGEIVEAGGGHDDAAPRCGNRVRSRAALDVVVVELIVIDVRNAHADHRLEMVDGG